ncbi:MAG: type II toxin-antitoxin system HicA family toxin [Verrucomicrobia bacterium]|nr:type II toxin-antitoxin system HicA family toxin [Verrucomicrobiota bacterium]
MKRRDLIQKIEQAGATFIRHGGKHDWYQQPVTKICQPVPRHNEINEHLARSILRKLAAPSSPPPAKPASP